MYIYIYIYVGVRKGYWKENGKILYYNRAYTGGFKGLHEGLDMGCWEFRLQLIWGY